MKTLRPLTFTVYPPLSQLVFAAAARLGAGHLAAGTLALKAILLAVECGVLTLLYALDRSRGRAGLVLYALSPLVIVEVCGNGHFESFALLGLLVAVWGFRQNRPRVSGVGLGVGVLAKLVPALAGPALLTIWWRGTPDGGTDGGTLGGAQTLPAPSPRRAAAFLAAALLATGAGLAAFLWSLRSGQFDDIEGARQRILDDDAPRDEPTNWEKSP